MQIKLEIPNYNCRYFRMKEYLPGSGDYFYCKLKKEFIFPGIPEYHLCKDCKDVSYYEDK